MAHHAASPAKEAEFLSAKWAPREAAKKEAAREAKYDTQWSRLYIRFLVYYGVGHNTLRGHKALTYISMFSYLQDI